MKFNYNDEDFHVNGNHPDDNNGISRNGLGQQGMKRYGNPFEQVYSLDNLGLAFKKARKRKTKFGSSMRSKSKTAQIDELLCKILAHFNKAVILIKRVIN